MQWRITELGDIKNRHPAHGLNSSAVASTRYNFTSSLHVVFQYLAAILIKGYIP